MRIPTRWPLLYLVANFLPGWFPTFELNEHLPPQLIRLSIQMPEGNADLPKRTKVVLQNDMYKFDGVRPALQPTGSADKAIKSPSISIELISDFLVVVKGQIANLDGLNFIVDTGTTTSVIDRKLADRLRLRRRAGEVTNFNHRLPIEWAEIPELRVGPIRLGATTVMVLKLTEYAAFAKNVDGVIGLDLLSTSEKLTIDYQEKTLSFQVAEGATEKRNFSGCLAIPFAVQGAQMQLIVDTGMIDTGKKHSIVLYRDRLRKRLPNMRTEGGSTQVALGRTKATRIQLPGVKIFGPEEVATAYLIDDPEESVLPGVAGYLGPAFLHAKRIEFDFAAKMLRWH